jgi:SAM-dependent methyltransferase
LDAPASSPFDAMAVDYDDAFTDSLVGRTMRDAVWRRLDVVFAAGDRVLELNCGTGVDAAHLAQRGVEVLATDASPTMVEAARRRGVDAHVCRAEEIDSFVADRAPFDGALSDFGGLNCVDDVGAVGRGLARALRPGATAVLCVMGPVVPWEMAWYLARLQPRRAFRRLAPSTQWRGTTIRYPSARATGRALAPWFEVRRCWALGALVPPSYAEPLAARAPRVLSLADRVERRIECWPGVAALADHYVLEVERRAGIEP